MVINNTVSFIKLIYLNFISMLFIIKFINWDNVSISKKIILTIITVFVGVIEFYLNLKFDILATYFIGTIVQVLGLKLISKYSVSNLIAANSIGIVLAYILLIISAIVEFVFQRLFHIDSNMINFIITIIIQLVFTWYVLRMKRLKRGLAFLQKRSDYIEIGVAIMCIFFLTIYSLIWRSSVIVISHLFSYLVVLSMSLVVIVQKILVMNYKKKLLDDTINQYKKDIEEKDNEIKRLTEEAFKVSKVNHEFYNRQKSLELMVKNALQNSKVETAEEIDIMERINKITEEHSSKMAEIKILPKLPLTEIKELDDMFTYMQSECSKSNISFKLKINGNIHSLTNNIIQKSKLETLIGDHIRDAIIAINCSDNSYKEILVVLGLKDNCYELSIFDTGIEFKIETLLNLGLKPITTHKDAGGSGIGFITTFETLKECKASLIIEEKHEPKDNDYTKSVNVRFDGKSEYRIKSYRVEEIFKDKKKDIDKELIVRKIN